MKNKLFLTIFIGILIGAGVLFSAGTVFVAVLVAATCYIISKSSLLDRKFLLYIFIAGFCLRAALSLAQDSAALLYFPDSVMKVEIDPNPITTDYVHVINERLRVFFKMPDSDYQSIRGYLYAAYAHGLDNKVMRLHIDRENYEFGWNGYSYVIGLYYYLFGYGPVSVKLINCFVGVINALIVFFLSLNFNRRVARISCFLVMFFPSLVLWSTANLKDTVQLCISLVLVYSTVSFLRRKDFRFLIVVFISMLVQYFFVMRNTWLISMIFLIMGSAVYYFMRSKQKTFLIVLLLFIVLAIPGRFKDRALSSIQANINRLCIIQTGYVWTRGVTYKIFDDKYYYDKTLLNEMGLIPFLCSLSKGFFHFMFEPLPQRISNPSSLVVFPQMLLWYGLTFFMLVGFFRAIQYNFPVMAVILLYTLLFSLPIALGSGNVGTVFRHRDLVTPFYLIFAANGISGLRLKISERIKHENILQAA